MHFLKTGILLLFLSFSAAIHGQGPPITSDKPIMLGGNTTVIKTLVEVRDANFGTFIQAPLLVHYLPTSNSLIGVHVPWVSYNFLHGPEGSGQALGDISILGKYQFYRKDGTGKTLRMVAKTFQTLPTGKKLELDGMSIGEYQSYIGLVIGYESIKYGVSNELGYNFIPQTNRDELVYKLGFGLPLLKSSYPVNQVNLYFEYQARWFSELNEYLLLYAQGIQYAKNRFTYELALQVPMLQTMHEHHHRKFSLFLGTRFAF